MASARSQSTPLNQSAAPPPLNAPLETNFICSNWKLFFFFSFNPPSFLFLCRTTSQRVLMSFLLAFSPHICCVWIRRTLQTVGPSHARTYTVAVYFKGERIGCGKGPRWARRCNPVRHNRTRRAANGLQNNGWALLMMFIIAIKPLLAHCIGRGIMQNENESIRYWLDVNCVLEISLCAGESLWVYLERRADGRTGDSVRAVFVHLF